jgi:hypothetical protein
MLIRGVLRRDMPTAPCVIHKNIDRAKSFNGTGNNFIRRSGFGEIARDRQAFTTLSFNRRNRIFYLVSASRDANYACTYFGECPSGLLADPATGTGDDRHLAVESKCVKYRCSHICQTRPD